MHTHRCMVHAQVGLEPTTCCLLGRCSTTELPRQLNGWVKPRQYKTRATDLTHLDKQEDSNSYTLLLCTQIYCLIVGFVACRYVSCSLGCPYEGRVSPEAVADVSHHFCSGLPFSLHTLSLSPSLTLCQSACLPSCLFACLIICLPLRLPVCPSVCLSVCLPVCLFVCLPVCLPACLSVCLSVCL